MGARETLGARWYGADAYERECREWHEQQHARITQAIVVSKPAERGRIRTWLDAVARVIAG